MAVIKPFRGIRPPKKYVEEVASRPYDVLSSEEAREEAKGNEKSLYHIIKPEIDFPVGKDEHDADVYEKAAENFKNFQEKGWLVQDDKENYYVYAQTMNGRTQYGLVVGSYVDDYLTGVIKKHELTRKDKEEDRMKHVRINNANIEPVFFAYPENARLDQIIKEVVAKTPEYDFVSSDNIGHHFWVIGDEAVIKEITALFAEMPALYIADGHHRSAAAALVGAEKARQNPHHTGKEEYNYFMAVCFPDNQLKIMDYNRVVKDLNGLTPAEFLDALNADFYIVDRGPEIYHPEGLHNFSLYLNDGHWYSLDAKPGTYDDNDPIGVLDVTISSNLILDKILGMKDLRTDKRIDFVGGLRGLEELKRRVDSGEMIAALALYPVSMKQLIDIADTGNIMPPKTTWFEPKLRSGLVIHKLV
ncbi:MAG: DUF1015 domain-containing protein [Candidatus Symbiothrix sp.]|jgi:uncharacterized protein (DUF1015 family)|nr:DUF1015 domain-containing protein [Candidatus Symbiothrix sp.]